MNKPRLKAKVMRILEQDDMPPWRSRTRWWVRISYISNGQIHSHTEDYVSKRAALNALNALGDGVEIEEE